MFGVLFILLVATEVPVLPLDLGLVVELRIDIISFVHQQVIT